MVEVPQENSELKFSMNRAEIEHGICNASFDKLLNHYPRLCLILDAVFNNGGIWLVNGLFALSFIACCTVLH